MEGCTYLLGNTDDLEEKLSSFALDIRKLCKNLEPVISVCETAHERYDSVLEVCYKNFTSVLKAQTPGDLLGKKIEVKNSQMFENIS